MVTLKVEVNQGGDNGVPPKNYDTVDGKIVYENGAWVTYVARGYSFSKTEQITVTSPTLDCYVMMRYFLSNGDRETDPEHHFEVVWEEYRPFPIVRHKFKRPTLARASLGQAPMFFVRRMFYLSRIVYL